MIVVNIELWPGGDKNRKRNLGHMVITNDGTGTERVGNYRVTLSHAGIYYGKRKEPWKTGVVRNHLRMLSPYHLILRALQATISTGRQSRL
jgi:hypothetical protein